MSGWGTIYNQTIYSLRGFSQTLATLQEQASSGSRIIRASDDPSDAYRILTLRDNSQLLTSYAKNIDDVNSTLTNASASLQSITDLLVRVRTLTSQGASGTYTGINRMPIAQEINSLLEEAVSLGNSTNMGRSLFGGSNTSKSPYAVERVNGQITAVTYQGSLTSMDVPVAPGVNYNGTLVGDRVFSSDKRGTVNFLGDTGAKAGTGTSNVQGNAWLSVLHEETSYGPSAGIVPGTGAASGDTILGSHSIEVDAGARTIKLDNGTAVTFTGSEDNLKITNENGQVAYLNMQGWSGFGGPETVTATAQLSLDDGLTRVPIEGVANQVITDSRTGQVLYVDTTNIKQAGVEPIQAGGTYDLFGTLIHIRDLMANTRGLDETQQLGLLAKALDPLKEVSDGLSQNLTVVGGKLSAMQDLKSNVAAMKNSSNDQAAQLQDADIIEIATSLARTQALYQVTLSSATKLLSMSMLDYM